MRIASSRRSEAALAPRPVILGRVIGAHGVRGWLRIASYTEPADNLLQYPRWRLRGLEGAGAEYLVCEAQFDGRWLRARLEGVMDRDAAERLRGLNIEVARADLPAPAPREHYRDDLLGLRVLTPGGHELGRVSHFLDAPATPVMVVASAEGAELWIPAAPPHLVRVALERGELVVDWPAVL